MVDVIAVVERLIGPALGVLVTGAVLAIRRRVLRRHALAEQLRNELDVAKELPDGPHRDAAFRRVLALQVMLRRYRARRSALERRRQAYCVFAVLYAYPLVLVSAYTLRDLVQQQGPNSAAVALVSLGTFLLAVPIVAVFLLYFDARGLRLNPWRSWSTLRLFRIAAVDRASKETPPVRGVPIHPKVVRLRLAHERARSDRSLAKWVGSSLGRAFRERKMARATRGMGD